ITTIRPSPDSFSAGHAYLLRRNGLVSRIESSASQRSSGKSATGETCWNPAFGTIASRRPKRSRAASTAALLPSRDVRSAAKGSPGPSPDGLRSAASTENPSFVRRSVIAWPMPLAAQHGESVVRQTLRYRLADPARGARHQYGASPVLTRG